MNRKSFSAKSWLNTSQSQKQKAYSQVNSRKEDLSPLFNSSPLASFERESKNPEQEKGSLNKFFTPGWKGESLVSKNTQEFKKALHIFHKNAKAAFLKKDNLSRKLQIGIYDEFILFADYKALNCNDLDNYIDFWKNLRDSQSPYKNEINQFVEIFTFRIAVIFLLKVRFITTLLKQTEQECCLKDIYYPNSFLASQFRFGSSYELKAKAFEQNIFSWYRPGEDLKTKLTHFQETSTRLNITEIIKTVSIESERILDLQDSYYSHSISHKSYGEFTNSLLINFPAWLNTLKKKSTNPFIEENSGQEVISCKFAGDFLESTALSHWLAQDQNKNIKWDQILCPDFKCSEFGSGLYLKTFNEIQFLTFLAELANLQGQEPKRYISSIANSNRYNKKSSNDLQKSLLDNESIEASTYDRIVLNLSLFPKNNPHHYLFTQIAKQKSLLKDKGYLFVTTTKNLFAPSQKAKVEALSKELNIEAIFDLQNVNGKGEVGSYYYIFSKVNPLIVNYTNDKKKNCLNFRLSGSLNSFQEFTYFTDLTQRFFSQNLNDIPPLYQSHRDGARIEFYQDAIIEGRLIHSSSQDSSKITHPLFFKNLMNMCHPLDYFFDIQVVDFNQGTQHEEDLFSFSPTFHHNEAKFTLIVDQRNKENIRIEVIQTSALEAKAYEYGHTMCSYFHVYPKWQNINIFAIRDYFESSIGQQIINLTFNNQMRKVKGNLSKLFTPRFFIESEEIPENVQPALSLLSKSVDELMSMYPGKIEEQYNNISSLLDTLIKKYPGPCLSNLSAFRRSILQIKEKVGIQNKKSSINFNNPTLKTPLLLSKTHGIYPNNKEIYIDFNSEGAKNVHSPLIKTKKIFSEKDGYKTYGLELYSQEGHVLTMLSDEGMILFLEFILAQTIGMQISQILQSVSVPTIEDLKSILSSYLVIEKSIISIYSKTCKDYDQLLGSTIFQQSSH